MIGLPYTTKIEVIDKSKLNYFKRTASARDLRKAKVTSLIKSLEAGQHFSSGFVINIKKNQKRILDANHRWEAIKSYLARYPTESIQITVHYYKDLTDEEERQVYTIWNLGTKQNTSDFVQAYWKTFNIVKQIEKRNEYPLKVSHKNGSTTMALHILFSPYLTKDVIPYKGGFDKSAVELVQEIQKWNSGRTEITSNGGTEAYNTMREFLKDFTLCFGKYTPNSAYWRAPVFFPIFRIWYDNLQSLKSITDLRTQLKKLTSGVGYERVLYWKSMGAPRGVCEKAVKDFLQVINSNRKTNRLFINSKENGKKIRIYGVY